MNSIPVVGPDAGIAPRTGSGSPQTPAQQRADTAPTVLSDTGVSADPGVLLKITPPVLARESNINVDQRMPADQLAAFLAKQQLEKQTVALALGNSAEQADQALLGRVAQVFSALPPDVQEAIRNASTPAIAQLLKLAALTASGIKEAPAVIETVNVPVAKQADVAASHLLQEIAQSDAFRLASTLRGILQDLSFGVRTLTEAESSGRAMLNQNGYRADQSPVPLSRQPTDPDIDGAPISQNSGSAGVGGIRTAAELTPEITPSNSDPVRNQFASKLYQDPSQSMMKVIDQLISTPREEPTEALSQSVSTQSKETGGTLLSPAQTGMSITPEQAEKGLREGLKLLMDGRMVWQGEFTPGVPLRLERSDAWQADRRGLSGMDKGTSLRVQLRLPSVGLLEVRAFGFQGQVSVRVHAEPQSTSTFAGALPELITRLKERGLSGTQVVVDSL